VKYWENKKLNAFESLNSEILEECWADHLELWERGLGYDRIKVTEEMYWEFVDEIMFDVENGLNPMELKLPLMEAM